jgi:hypothetical protein
MLKRTPSEHLLAFDCRKIVVLLRRYFILGLVVVLVYGVTQGLHAQDSDSYTHVEIADCHVHLLDFLQNGDFYVNGKFIKGGTLNQPLRPGYRIEALLKMMDYAHVSQALVMGMPFVKKWSANDPARGRYYLDNDSPVTLARETDYTIAEAILDYRKMSSTDKGKGDQLRRIHPFVCGFDATDLGSVDRITKTIKLYPGVFKGIGEVMSRHDDLTNLTSDDRPSADHPALRRIYDFAGLHGMPVSIHHNMAPISPSGAFSRPAYLKELVTCFEQHPKTKFIWCHAGVSRRIIVKDLPGILDSVLTPHKDHVYIDLSWVLLEDYIYKDLASWVALIKKYPDNFIIGSDNVGSLRNYVSTIRAHDKLLGAIGDETVVKKVASENFIRLMPKEGVTLNPGYLYPEDKYLPSR